MKRYIHLTLALLLFISLFAACGDKEPQEQETAPDLAVTEVMPSNKASLADAYGNYPDWIEITNRGADPVNLKDYCLSNDPDNLSLFTFPDQELGAGEALVVFTSSDAAFAGGTLHATFNLDRKDDRVILSHGNGDRVSELAFSGVESDLSVLENGTVTPYLTPGFPNTDEGYAAYQATVQMPKGLVISEVMNSNSSLIPHDGDVCSDWVELYNNSDVPLNLSGYYLSDDYAALNAHRLPDQTLEPHGYAIIYCDSADEDYETYVTGFGLGSDEELFLASQNGIQDAVTLRDIPADVSYGRLESGGYGYFDTPTPGAANGQGYAMLARKPVPSQPQGVYNDVTSLSVSLTGEGTIYYTTDGSEPTTASAVYSAPFTLDKTSVIRAMSVCDGKMNSWIATASYIINENHTIPVLSLVTDEKNMFDPETGIYVEGNHTNYSQDWEKPANVSLFESGKEMFSTDCGLQMFGSGSRRSEAKKSMRVNFKSKYGASRIDCDLYGDGVTKYKSLVIRGGEATNTVVFRTEAFTTLAKDTKVLTQNSKFCAVYLNGEFFGVFDLCERFSAYYYAQHFGVDEESVTLIDTPVSSSTRMGQFIAYARENDMSTDENYRYMDENIDLESMIDWFTLECYSANVDILGNLRYIYSEGDKIKWAFYDLDWAFYGRDRYYLITEGEEYSVIIEGLLENPDFRERFINRTGEILNTVLQDENMLGIIDYYHDMLAPEMERERQVWTTGSTDYESWERDVAKMKAYITDYDIREEMIESLDEAIDLTDEELDVLRTGHAIYRLD